MSSRQILIPHLDRHLAIPLLTHLSETSLFPAEQVARAQCVVFSFARTRLTADMTSWLERTWSTTSSTCTSRRESSRSRISQS